MRRFAASLCALALAGCAAQAEQQSRPMLGNVAPATENIEKPAPVSPPAGQQWLYGSAEGTIASVQVFHAMAQYVRSKALNRAIKSQAILAEGSTPDSPRFESCGTKPLAAVFDADETLIWNVGAMRYMAEQGKDFDPAIWDKWEKSGAGKAIAMPGAIEALKAMRDAGVTIIANTNRSAANATGSEDTLRAAGLGEFRHKETLYLMGDTPDGSSKDGRRAFIAAKYCVLALAGDQLGDFAQAFNAKGLSLSDRRKLASNPEIASLWGNGWFLFSNPVYGPSIRGGFEEVFTPESKWEPSK